MKGWLRQLVGVVTLAGLLASASIGVGAQAKPGVRPMLLRWSERTALLSYSAKDFVDRQVREKLNSGLPQTLLTRVYAYAEGAGTQPLGAQVVSCRVVFDLWEGRYRVQRHTTLRDKSVSLGSIGEVVETCLATRELVLGNASTFASVRGKRVYFATIIELNPLSSDTVQRIRRWLSRPSGDALRGDAFFGSFVSIFVSRKLGSAEKTLTFRSALHSVPR